MVHGGTVAVLSGFVTIDDDYEQRLRLRFRSFFEFDVVVELHPKKTAIQIPIET